MERFSRWQALIGEDSLNNLKEKKVIICGLGGVGSYAAEALARSAVGELVLIDFDKVDISNINRQLIALDSTIGRTKAEVMAERILSVNPGCRIKIIEKKLEEDNISELIDSDADFVCDCIDDVPAKTALIVYCHNEGIPLISAMGTGNKLDPSALEISDIKNTEVCPLCRSMRKRLREYNIEKGVTVVYSRERPLKPENCAVGSSAFVPPSAGLLMAGHIINNLLK